MKNELQTTQTELAESRAALLDCRRNFLQHGNADETAFLKYELPLLRSRHYFLADWLQVLLHLPKSPARQQIPYYIGWCRTAERFFQQHYTFYAYYQLGHSHLDNLYFIRGLHSEATLHLPLADPAFSTEVSELFARFIAYEQLRDQVLDKIIALGGLPLLDTWQEPYMGKRLQWTGGKVNLVELIYGLYLTGQLNHGEATINDITLLLTDLFQCSAGHVHHIWQDIRLRKRLAPTQFLDQMRERVQQAVEASFI